ncbi:MAG: sterol desaturase family protein [Pseudomonadota bacterium]
MTAADPTLLDAARNIARAAPHIFTNDLLRYALGAGGVFLLVNVALTGVLADRRLGDRTRPAGQVAREILASFRTVIVFTFAGGGMVVALRTFDIDRLYADPAEHGWGYFALSLALAIVLHDAWFYWTHRLIHDRRLFRRVHRLHHRSKKPTPFTSYAFNTGEAALNAVFMPLLVATVPMSGLAIVLFLAHMMVRNAVGHCGYEVFPARRDGRPLFDWMTTVTHHDLHHENGGYNFGLYFSWWDRLMGTEHPNYRARFAAAVGRWLEPERPRKAPVAAVVFAVIALFGAARADAAPQDDIEAISGLWATERGEAVVRLGPCADDGELLCGWMEWAWDPDDLASARKPMLEGFQFRDGSFRKGRLYAEGRAFRGAIAPEAGLLRLRGCAGPFCREQVWRRHDGEAACVFAAPL